MQITYYLLFMHVGYERKRIGKKIRNHAVCYKRSSLPAGFAMYNISEAVATAIPTQAMHFHFPKGPRITRYKCIFRISRMFRDCTLHIFPHHIYISRETSRYRLRQRVWHWRLRCLLSGKHFMINETARTHFYCDDIKP